MAFLASNSGLSEDGGIVFDKPFNRVQLGHQICRAPVFQRPKTFFVDFQDKCHASSNTCLTSSNKKLVETIS